MVVHNEWEALCVAVEMERRAIRVYNRALMLAEDDTVREGIRTILEQEKNHLARFIEMREQYDNEDGSEREEALLQAMGAEMLFPGGVMEMERSKGLSTQMDLYRFAADSERNAMETYLAFSKKCHHGHVSEAFRSIAAEECRHLASFQEMLK